MAAHYLGGDAATSGCPKALLLCGDAFSPEDEKLGKLLSVLGVSWQVIRLGEVSRLSDRGSTDAAERFCVLASASAVAGSIEGELNPDDALPVWMIEAE